MTSPEAREGLCTHGEERAQTVAGYHSDWVCVKCGRRRSACGHDDKARAALTPAGPEERGEGLREHRPVLRTPAGNDEPQLECACGWLWDDGDIDLPEGESFMRHAATPAPDTGAEERLRAALARFCEVVDVALTVAMVEAEDGSLIPEWQENIGDALDDARAAPSGGSVDEEAG